MIRGLALAFLLVAIAAFPARAEDEDHQRVCPLLTADLLHAIAPELAGHGSCSTFCRGCGCKGGPGYRDQAKHCVGYAELLRKCGPPPHAGCVAECAPLAKDCGQGRVWLKTVAAKHGMSVQFVPAKE